MPDDFETKAGLRRKLLAHRQEIPAEVRAGYDTLICARLLAWWEAQRPDCVGVYWPIRSEPDLRNLYRELSARGARLALPAVSGKDAPLDFLAWKPGDALARDSYGVMVPRNAIRTIPAALLVPCVGFNGGNYRLGYGGGFYDRTLARQPRPAAVGVAYACGRAEFEVESFDIPLDLVITEA